MRKAHARAYDTHIIAKNALPHKGKERDFL